MSLFTMALGGAAAGASRTLDKYIDEDIAKARAQMMADLTRKNAGLIRQDDAAFADQRAPILRQQRVDDETAIGDVRNQTALRGDINRAQSPELLAAESKRADAVAASALRAKKAEASDAELTAATVLREKAILTGTMNEKAKAAGLLARATDLGGGVRALQADLLRMDIGDKKRLGTLYDDYLKITNSDLPDADKAKKLAPITNAIAALKSKNGVGGPGAGKGAGAEYDLVKIKEEETLPGGGTRTTERTEKRKAGAGGEAATEDPFMVPNRSDPNAQAKDPYAKAAPTPPARPLIQQAEVEIDPNSWAGKQRAAREGRANAQASQESLRAVEAANAADAARQLLATGDRRALFKFQSSPAFDLLDMRTKAAISAAVNGR